MGDCLSKITYRDFEDMYSVKATVYFIEIYKAFDKQDFLRLCETVRYYCQKDNISYLFAFSTTDSKTAKPKYQMTGKRGRPRKVIQGKKVDGHIHNAFVGDKNKSCRQTILKIAKAINKKETKKITKINSISNGVDVHDYAGYILRQSDIIRSGGEFNFQEFYDKGI